MRGQPDGLVCYQTDCSECRKSVTRHLEAEKAGEISEPKRIKCRQCGTINVAPPDNVRSINRREHA